MCIHSFALEMYVYKLYNEPYPAFVCVCVRFAASSNALTESLQ